MSTDPGFARRLRRLIAISAVALGLIFLLAYTTTDAGWIAYGLLIGGWLSMPLLLAVGSTRPLWRYLLVIPASLMTAGLVIVALESGSSAVARLGWWTMTAGLLVGGTLGAWFWYRWAPVPRRLDQPFAAGRWVLIALHAGLVVVGGILVMLGERM
jgi:hypothetical protein